MTTSQLALPALTSLPSVFVIPLDNYSAVSLKGEDQTKYLQGQVTCDVTALNEVKLMNGAHCNAKGKMYAAFRLFNYQGAHLVFQPKATLASSLAELKKFGVFAKVEITETTHLSYNIIAGKGSASVIKDYFQQLPNKLNPIVEKDNEQVVYLSGQTEQYLLITPTVNPNKLIESTNLPTLSSKIWTLLEITDGFPTMSEQAIEQYVPQMLNLQAINGISFTKGCYLGQETVARMKYLGKNKRALYHLTGSVSETVTAGSIIEMSIGENWRKAGDVIASYQDEQGLISIQAVLASDLEQTVELRVKQDEASKLTITALPYSLIEDE